MFGLSNFLPPDLQEIAQNAPRIIFRSLPLSQLMVEAAQTAKNMLDVEKQSKMKAELKHDLPLIGIELQEHALESIRQLSSEQGESLLKLYFLQLKRGRRIFLDLRSSHFTHRNQKLGWHPSALIHEFSVGFHQGILLLYSGFFNEDDAKMDQGLTQTGMALPDWNSEKKTELRNLFKNHFGNAQTESVFMNLETFKKSFTSILDFLDKEQVRIGVDFLYFGIYLVSLYLSLDGVKSPLPVGRIYHEIFNGKPR